MNNHKNKLLKDFQELIPTELGLLLCLSNFSVRNDPQTIPFAK